VPVTAAKLGASSPAVYEILGARAGSNTAEQIAKADRRLARLRAQRVGLTISIHRAVDDLLRGVAPVTVAADLCRNAFALMELTPDYVHVQPDERGPARKQYEEGDGFSPLTRRILERSDAWYESTAWWAEDRQTAVAA
jgi:hypothetical protein